MPSVNRAPSLHLLRLAMEREAAKPASLMDRQLAEQAANAGRMLEAAYSVADRELALIWQRTMFDIVKLRRARRFGVDTQHVKGGAE